MSSVENVSQIEADIVSLISEIEYRSLPTSTQDRARLLLKDQLALQVGISELPWSRNIYSYGCDQMREGASTIVADGRKVDAPTAAFVNAAYGHGFEYDDAHDGSNSHPGSVAVSTSLAVGEQQDATMEEILTAISVGYEVYARIGNLAAPDLLMTGWHPHAVLGPFGAAAATASLWGLDETQTAHALSIAASHSSGFTEYSSTGGSVKRVHSGMGARSGIESARMAKHGVTGPRKFITGKKGFLSAFIGTTDIGDTNIGQLTDFELDTAWIKPYCCCGCNHAYIDALRAINPDPNDIERMVARIQPETDVIVGTQNENVYEPTDIVEAQYSLPFQLALTTHGYGNAYQTHRRILNGELLNDEDLLETTSKIEMIVEEDLDTPDSSLVGDLEIEFAETSERKFVEHSKGRGDNRLTEEEFQTKFNDLTAPILGKEPAEELATALVSFDLNDPVTELMERTYI